MALNLTQRQTLRTILSDSVSEILKFASGDNLLEKIITSCKLNKEQALAILQDKPNLITGIIREIMNIPEEIRNDFKEFEKAFRERKPISAELWKKLEKHPNYNPLLIAEMHRFEEQLAGHADDNTKNLLIRLRELFLEMTPKHAYSYGGDNTFYFRIGTVPLNLDKYGGKPLAGEISADISAYLTDRLETHRNIKRMVRK